MSSLAWIIISLSLLHETRCFSIVDKPIRRKESSLQSSVDDLLLAQALQRSSQSTNPLDQLFDSSKKNPTWYESLNSLPFDCTECGKCCQTKGDVYLDPAETKNAADLLDLSVEDFKEQHVARVEHFPTDRHEIGWTVLKHKEEDGITQCIFLKDKKCGIYGARPLQCSTYPFWPRFMDDVEGWNDEVVEEGGERLWTYEEGGCEGMQRVAEGKAMISEGVSLSKATEQLELYKRYKKRFPRDDLVTVDYKNKNC
eukprot:scaffold588_cov282-Chaetoceros_neogracile.AAC.20